MKLKRKIFLGLLFLFGLSVLVAGIAAYYNRKLANDSEAILKDNYNSVIYAKDMLKALAFSNNTPEVNLALFEHSLQAQHKNITEKGEQELSDSIADQFQKLKANPASVETLRTLNRLLFGVMELNMKTIEKRNAQAQLTAQHVFNYLLFSGLFFLVVAIAFMVRFPAYIAVPILKRDADKTNLMATVSHELKTPAASIKLSTKLLEDDRVGNLNAEQKQLIANIKEDTERVLKITEAVLSMAQLEAGKIQLNIHPGDPKKIIEYALEATHLQAEQKQIKVDVSTAHDLPEVDADVEKTAWVLINLLSNAIRYSPSGSVVSVNVTHRDSIVEFFVTDAGGGIEPKYLDKVFDRFFRIPGSNQTGNGLGLAISKEFIEAQGGTIRVESQVGTGSTFCFVLKANFLNDFLI